MLSSVDRCCSNCVARQLLFLCAAFQAVRCQVLDYFVRQREGLKEDHVLFSFERSMTFSKAEFALIDQVWLSSHHTHLSKYAHVATIWPSTTVSDHLMKCICCKFRTLYSPLIIC